MCCRCGRGPVEAVGNWDLPSADGVRCSRALKQLMLEEPPLSFLRFLLVSSFLLMSALRSMSPPLTSFHLLCSCILLPFLSISYFMSYVVSPFHLISSHIVSSVRFSFPLLPTCLLLTTNFLSPLSSPKAVNQRFVFIFSLPHIEIEETGE